MSALRRLLIFSIFHIPGRWFMPIDRIMAALALVK
jgi:hypothetical protein